jgi:hypothetical protein
VIRLSWNHILAAIKLLVVAVSSSSLFLTALYAETATYEALESAIARASTDKLNADIRDLSSVPYQSSPPCFIELPLMRDGIVVKARYPGRCIDGKYSGMAEFNFERPGDYTFMPRTILVNIKNGVRFGNSIIRVPIDGSVFYGKIRGWAMWQGVINGFNVRGERTKMSIHSGVTAIYSPFNEVPKFQEYIPSIENPRKSYSNKKECSTDRPTDRYFVAGTYPGKCINGRYSGTAQLTLTPKDSSQPIIKLTASYSNGSLSGPVTAKYPQIGIVYRGTFDDFEPQSGVSEQLVEQDTYLIKDYQDGVEISSRSEYRQPRPSQLVLRRIIANLPRDISGIIVNSILPSPDIKAQRRARREQTLANQRSQTYQQPQFVAEPATQIAQRSEAAPVNSVTREQTPPQAKAQAAPSSVPSGPFVRYKVDQSSNCFNGTGCTQSLSNEPVASNAASGQFVRYKVDQGSGVTESAQTEFSASTQPPAAELPNPVVRSNTVQTGAVIYTLDRNSDNCGNNVCPPLGTSINGQGSNSQEFKATTNLPDSPAQTGFEAATAPPANGLPTPINNNNSNQAEVRQVAESPTPALPEPITPTRQEQNGDIQQPIIRNDPQPVQPAPARDTIQPGLAGPIYGNGSEGSGQQQGPANPFQPAPNKQSTQPNGQQQLVSVPNVPFGLYPTNQGELAQPIPLGWRAVPGATRYRITVKDQSTGAFPVDDRFITGDTFTVSGLPAGRSYSWDVAACNQVGCSERSRNGQFRTGSVNAATLSSKTLTYDEVMSSRERRIFDEHFGYLARIPASNPPAKFLPDQIRRMQDRGAWQPYIQGIERDNQVFREIEIQKIDYCGSSNFNAPEKIGFIDISSACKTHDGCYASTSTQQQCDIGILKDITNICIRNLAGSTCFYSAIIYYDALFLRGNPAYENAQRRRRDL